MICRKEVIFLAFKGCLKCHGSTLVGERGQVVLPVELRKALGLKPGERLIVLGADTNGFQRVILMKAEAVERMFSHLFNVDQFIKDGGVEGLDRAVERTGVRKIADSVKRGKKKGVSFKSA